MRQHLIGALVVVHAAEKSRPAGIVTDRDLVLTQPDMDAADAVRLMKEHQVRRLILTDKQERLVGILSMEDLLESLTRELASLAAGVASASDREIRQRK